MPKLRDALVSGSLAAVVGIVAVLALSFVVPPPLDLPPLVAVIGAATFIAGAVGRYAMETDG